MNILTPEELAIILKVPRRTVIEKISRLDGFPKSVTGRRKPRWDQDAVSEFFRMRSSGSQNTHKKL
jgi:hypothetical protein